MEERDDDDEEEEEDGGDAEEKEVDDDDESFDKEKFVGDDGERILIGDELDIKVDANVTSDYMVT